jgi:hypothetical protein
MRSLPLLLIVIAIPLGVSTAQQDVPRRWSVPDSATLSRLHARVHGRRRVRIVRSTPTAPYSRPVEVAYPTLYDTGIWEANGSELTPWADVSRLQVRTSAFSRGLLVGSLFGGAVGLIAGAAAAHECHGGSFFEWCGASGGDVAAGTLVSALAFGFLGGLIAAPFGRWSTVYQAQPEVPTPAITLRPTDSGGIVLVTTVTF